VHEAKWVLKKIDEDLKIIMEDFWNGPVERRTCKECGHVIQRAAAFTMGGGKKKVKGAGAKKGGRAAGKKKGAGRVATKVAKKAAKKPVKKAGRRR